MELPLSETISEEKNSTQSISSNTDATEDLQKTETDLGLSEKHNANIIEGLPEDYTSIPEQSFDIENDTWGNMKFISGYVGEGFSDDLRFFYVKENQVVYEFPAEKSGWGFLDDIKAVAFRDISGDGKKDVIIIYSYYMGAGSQGAIPRTMSRIYIASENEYTIDVALETEIWNYLGFDTYTVDDVCQYISMNYQNYEEVISQYRRVAQNDYYEEYSVDYNEWEKKSVIM